MSESHRTLLERYSQLPDRLESALVGLPESDHDWKLNEGWSIRAYVHHTVEGELMWQLYLRAILGRNGIIFPIQWYFELPQDEWAKQWAYDTRVVHPTLALFRAATSTMAECLAKISPDDWKHHGCVTWPGEEQETRLSVRDILLVDIRHVNQHVSDIQQIRVAHKS